MRSARADDETRSARQGGSAVLTGTSRGIGMARQTAFWLMRGGIAAVGIKNVGLPDCPVSEAGE